MKKVFTKLSAFILVLSFVFAMSGAIYIPKSEAQFGGPTDPRLMLYALTGINVDNPIKNFAAGIVDVGLNFVSLLTGLAGMVLNGIVFHTVVNVTENYNKIESIDVAWKTIRDVANMGFIFILLYAAIMTIIGQGRENQSLIVKVVVIAILINFSLFFTAVIIDASNLMALIFYEAIAPDIAREGFASWGLSNAFMQHLNLSSLYTVPGEQVITYGTIITTGIMGSILLLIAAFSFFAVALMFLIRYVVLIIVLILSPIAFMAMVLPQLKPQADKWWAALTGQAIFAPIYFMLTWITLMVLSGITGTKDSVGVFGKGEPLSAVSKLALNNGSVDISFFSTFINFAVVIVFLIVSLVIAKDWASKGPGVISSMNKWATGKAGALTLGTVGWAGRNTIGRGMQAIGESETLKNARSTMIKRGGLYGAIGGAGVRLTQATAKKGGSSSFDMRGTGMTGALDAGKAQKGGYEAWRKAANKKEEEYAKSQEPSDKAKAKAKKEVEDAKNADTTSPEFQKEREKERAARRVVVENLAKERARETNPDKKIELDKKIRNAQEEHDKTENSDAYKKDKIEKAQIKLDELVGNKVEVEKRAKAEEEEKKKAVEKIKNSEELKAAELAERSAQDTVNRLEAEAKAAVGTADEDRRKLEVEAAKVNLKKTQEAAKEIRRINKEAIEKISGVHDEKIKQIKDAEIKPAAERRKAAEADAVEKSKWAKFRGYNYTAAAQIRKGKKGAKELIEEALKETGEKKDEKPPEETPPATPTP